MAPPGVMAQGQEAQIKKNLAERLPSMPRIEEVKRKMVLKEEILARRASIEAAKVAIKAAAERASVTPLASVPLAGISGTYAVLLAQPTPDGMVNIVGVLSDVKDALVETLFAQMAKKKVDEKVQKIIAAAEERCRQTLEDAKVKADAKAAESKK